MTDTSKKAPVPVEGESKIDLFQRQGVRKVLHEGEWWFSVKDVLEVLTDTKDGNRYSRDLRDKDEGLKSRWAEITRTLPFATGSGTQDTTFISIEGMFRLMQSVPTKKAEPFKKWLARVGFERLQEIENPELAVKRAIALYRAKGYEDEWIEARIVNKASREALTAEWYRSGIVGKYIAFLTDAISVETFGINVQSHKNLKGLQKQSLRDNMTPIELTLTTLGEQATTAIIKSTNPHTYDEHKVSAQKGGRIAGKARREIQEATGKMVISSENYLTSAQRQNNEKINQEINQLARQLLKTGAPETEDIPY